MNSVSVQEAAKFYWYHCIDLGNYTTDGDYDMDEVVDYYGIPADLRGKTVLDVGRGSGYFSFLMEARGADVTSTELPSFFDWDFVGGDNTRRQRLNATPSPTDFTRRHIQGAFEFAHQVKRSRVKTELLTVYEVSPERLGRTFDVVFCGSVLSHVRDPALALERLHSVTRERLILSCPIVECNDALPVMALVGTSDSDRRSWWVPNTRCVVEMLRCGGFEGVDVRSPFDLVHRKTGDTVRHGVFHAFA